VSSVLEVRTSRLKTLKHIHIQPGIAVCVEGTPLWCRCIDMSVLSLAVHQAIICGAVKHSI
jgi:hypothetical protein